MLEEKLDVLVVADVIDEDTKKYIEGNCLDDNYIEKYKKLGDNTGFFYKKTIYRVVKDAK